MNQELFQNYLTSVSSKYSHTETSEMGYRTDFELLLKGIFESIHVSRFDHDARANLGNKPDFVVVKNDVPILYIETKDIGVSLDKIEKSEQMSRYYGYDNLVLTDYVEFRFYRNGQSYGEPIKIAEYDKNSRTISPLLVNFEYLAKTLVDFTQSHKEPIKSGKHLSKIMGGKAQRIRDNVRQFLAAKSDRNEELTRVYETIKKLLVHDLTEETFADMYAQTLVYGLFVARFYDESSTNFTRQEARDLIPKSNPLLRNFFDHIVGPNFDKRLEYIVNELCNVFSHADVDKLMYEYLEIHLKGKTHRRQDTVIHFYEDFLNEYDPDLRRKMGAYYTPLPVVEFIVKAVDHLLQKQFNLPKGLADTDKLPDGKHRVQVLDPAVGTGTFISAVIGEIFRKFKGQEGRWPAYVLHDLLPRVNGFELMIAPYTIAHLKLGMAFKETGFKYFNNRRLGIYLTNSLEQAPKQDSLFNAFGLAESIAEESKVAAVIKNKTPIMVVVGNPPYSVSSSNKGEWITDLIKVYKENLNERNIQPLSDDYIKFIRYAEHFIEKNKSGIVAMITNNSFLDGIIHRQMRKHLLDTFDDIYILDLHGNTKKKEKMPGGGKDENVFDIQQGVSINIFIKSESLIKGLGKVHHSDLYGTRTLKFNSLSNNSIASIKWETLSYSKPYYFFVPKDFHSEEEYLNGFKISDLCSEYSSGVTSFNDNLVIDFTNQGLNEKKLDLTQLDEPQLRHKYDLVDTRDWKLANVIKDLPESKNIDFLYRPFDVRKVLYTSKTKGVLSYPRDEIMKNFVAKENIGIQVSKQQSTFDFQHVLVSKMPVDRNSISMQTREATYFFPLYIYNDDGSKVTNFKKEIVVNIEKIAGKVSPEDVFDYIYAVLYSPTYRQKYKALLKIDFPRIPYPKDKAVFFKFVKYGADLRELHLLEPSRVKDFITTFSEAGSDTVERFVYKDGSVYINDVQFFGNVPEIAWNFYIGGYQPAQKWLKDRRGRQLNNEEIEHYQKIIVSLMETSKIMEKIDQIIESNL